MPKNMNTRARGRQLTKQHKIAIAGVTTLGAAAVAFSAIPSSATTAHTASPAMTHVAYSSDKVQNVQGTVADQLATENVKLQGIAAKTKAQAEAQQKAAAAATKKAAQERSVKEAVSRSTQRLQVQPMAAKTYTDNLNGWITHALDIMHAKGIPGSYSGLHRNIMRESSGNPMAINDWDINAINGIPSKGLLQVIPPTFKAYHVTGTSWNIYDPVANITAAANYAADKYGSIDNVNSAY
ncbi:transglycosylase SLT domain-containing protein [Streptomyces sp. NPDC046805]|uniref:transglycosylase SLT domain-containing protein n=1 Tax=Streptomyces sp. NPDC046805 TaxID=3155134 RepID=UPI0033E4B82D